MAFTTPTRAAHRPDIMPQNPPSHSTRYETLVDAIRGYLATHPAAADTVEGIAGWAVGAVASVTADEVHSALAHLEARGEVAKRRAEGGAEIFARTDALPRVAVGTLRLGVDLGGTKTEIIALGADGREELRRREPTPRDDYDAILRLVATLVADAEAACGVRAGDASVGVGTPGSLSRVTGLLRGSNSVCLNGMPVKRDLETRLGRTIAMANDANCFALSEATDGAGSGAPVVFGVILGTGVGGGIVVNGRVLEGRNAIAGEWGHNPLPWPNDDERPGPACFCGQRGCIETWLSGPALARDHHAGVSGEMLPAEAIVARAAQQDVACTATLARYEERLARALAHVVNVVDPDVIVLGGGLSNVDRWYKSVPRLWTRWVFSDRVDTQLVRHAHGDSSGVRGAAWLVP
jgi:fructokinase